MTIKPIPLMTPQEMTSLSNRLQRVLLETKGMTPDEREEGRMLLRAVRRIVARRSKQAPKA